MNITISKIKKDARHSLGGNWGKGVLLTLIISLLSIILTLTVEVSVSGGFTNWLMQDETPFMADFLNIILSIAIIPLSVAIYWFYLSLARFEGPKVLDVFSIFADVKTYLKLIGTTILSVIFITLWLLLLIIPGIIKSLSYSQAYYLLKDHPEYSALEAITESKKRMKGYKWKYFLMNLSFIGWALLCILSLGIGFLWLSPYISTSQAVFYNELIASQDDYSYKGSIQ